MSTDCPILIIEDNPIDLDLSKLALEEITRFRSIVVARDGQEALDFLDGWTLSDPLPCIVLLDLKLPKYSGFELLERFRNHPKFAATPIIVLSSSDDEGDINRAYQLGANSYLVKPVKFDDYMSIGKCIKYYWFQLNQFPI
jgi:hypothetical protein